MKDIPSGWVRVAQYDERDDKNGGGPSGDYARILAAVKADPSPIRAYKDGKYWVACKEDIDAFLSTFDSSEESISPKPAVVQFADKRQTEAAVIALCEINNGLAEIGSTLRDLVAAVQLLGEQHSKQREAVGSWRDMNGEAL